MRREHTIGLYIIGRGSVSTVKEREGDYGSRDWGWINKMIHAIVYVSAYLLQRLKSGTHLLFTVCTGSLKTLAKCAAKYTDVHTSLHTLLSTARDKMKRM